MAALVRGVRAGKVDAAAVMAEVETSGPSAEQRATVEEALRTLHATLTQEQRRELVDAIAKHGPDKRGGPPGGDDHGPRGRGPHDGAHGPGGRGGPLGHLLEGIELTDAQRASIDQALAADQGERPDREAMKQHHEAFHAQMKARLEAFASEAFDAKAFATPLEGAGPPREHVARMVDDMSRVVPILDAAQRETLASRLEKGPPGKGRDGKQRRGAPPGQ